MEGGAHSLSAHRVLLHCVAGHGGRIGVSLPLWRVEVLRVRPAREAKEAGAGVGTTCGDLVLVRVLVRRVPGWLPDRRLAPGHGREEFRGWLVVAPSRTYYLGGGVESRGREAVAAMRSAARALPGDVPGLWRHPEAHGRTPALKQNDADCTGLGSVAFAAHLARLHAVFDDVGSLQLDVVRNVRPGEENRPRLARGARARRALR